MNWKERIKYSYDVDWRYGFRSLKWYVGLTPQEKGIALVYEIVYSLVVGISVIIILWGVS